MAVACALVLTQHELALYGWEMFNIEWLVVGEILLPTSVPEFNLCP